MLQWKHIITHIFNLGTW